MPSYKDKTGRWRYRFAYKSDRYSGSAPKDSNTKKTADALAKDHIERLVANVHTGPMPTIGEFSPRFLQHQAARTKPLTQRSQRLSMAVYLIPHLGSVRLDELRKEHIDRFVTALRGEKLAPASINAHLAVLQRLLSIAVEWTIIVKAPKIDYLKVPKQQIRFLSEAEAKRLLDAAYDDWGSMMLVALRTGLRVGELRGLRWEDVDLDRGWLTVRRTAPGNYGLEPTMPKSNAGRDVPLSPEAIGTLRERRATNGNVGYIWPARVGLKRQPEKVRSEGGCIYAMRFATEAAGLKGIGWHTLRHTYASWLVMRAVPLRVVQKYMGHHSITQTERYAHLSPEFGHASIALLDLPLSTAPAIGTLPALPPGDDDE